MKIKERGCVEMIAQEYISLRQTADELGIEPWRLARLGRFLGISCGARLIPYEEVRRMKGGTPDDCYAAVLHWLLSRWLVIFRF